jgi:uncharacterized protein (DUF934 family)
MRDVFRGNGFVTDNRVSLADDQAIVDGAFFVSKARFLAERAALVTRVDDLGLVLEPSDTLEDLVGDLAAIGAIAIRFPKFGDGRGYSLARLLRDRHGYTGELRAIGDVLLDQVEAFLRVGFDALDVADPATRARLQKGLPDFVVRYQPVGNDDRAPLQGRPWASRGGSVEPKGSV